MKHTVMLTITSLMTLLLLTLHLADDIVRGFEKGGISNLIAVPVCVVWLYATLMLSERRSGYIIIFLGSLLGAFVPYVHFTSAAGVAGGRVASSSGALFFVWTLIAVGVTALFSILLSARGLWSLKGGRAGAQRPEDGRARPTA